MSNKTLIAVASVVVIIIPVSYFYQFYLNLGYPLSKDQNVWSGFGSFLGGSLSPILTFFTIILLVKSLRYQNEANLELTKQLKVNIKNEDLRTFENLFFNLINLQREIFSRFKVCIIENNQKKILYQEDAVKLIEDTIDNKFAERINIQKINELYQQIDEEYNIYDILRSFTSIVKLIEEKLDNETDRKSYYEKLINLTDFAQLRLICAAIQFETSKRANYLKNNKEFNLVLHKINLDFELYKY
jgi:hypothetical protein